MNKTTKMKDNLYQLNGRVPVSSAIPFGLQHVLIMFVTNLTPIAIIASAAGLSQSETTAILQNAMLIAGLATLVQLYPIWKIGAGMPLVMGISFKFVPVLYTIAECYGYGAVIGAILVGGIFEGILGLFAKYWRKVVSPVVAAAVVISIGFSLFAEGARSFGGGYEADFGSAQNLILGALTLVTCLVWSCLAKGYVKHLAILAGLVVGYIAAIFMGKVDFSNVLSGGVVALPQLLPYAPEFRLDAILSIGVIFLVSAAETIGDTSAMAVTGLDKEVEDKEISGALACDGFLSSVAGLFGCTPVTTFSQNVALIATSKVVNRFTIMIGAVCMILAGFVPVVGNVFATIPDAVLGGCTIMMLGTIFALGIEMLVKAGLNQRNVTILALSFAIGVGFTSASESAIWSIFPEIVCSVFATNVTAVVFVVAVILNLVLPKKMEMEHIW